MRTVFASHQECSSGTRHCTYLSSTLPAKNRKFTCCSFAERRTPLGWWAQLHAMRMTGEPRLDIPLGWGIVDRNSRSNQAAGSSPLNAARSQGFNSRQVERTRVDSSIRNPTLAHRPASLWSSCHLIEDRNSQSVTDRQSSPTVQLSPTTAEYSAARTPIHQ